MRPGVRQGAYLSSAATSVLALLTPGTLISLCKMSTMRCRAVMHPAMLILFSAILLTALLGAFLSRHEAEGGLGGDRKAPQIRG